jgi:hypothetical protein
VPTAAGELVDVVARLAAEQRGEFRLVAAEEMDGEYRGAACNVVGVVGDRQANKEPRRIDAGLRREPDQESGVIIVAPGSDDEHRVIKAVEKAAEIRRHLVPLGPIVVPKKLHPLRFRNSARSVAWFRRERAQPRGRPRAA